MSKKSYFQIFLNIILLIINQLYLKLNQRNPCPQTVADFFFYQMTVTHQITFQDYISLLGLIIKHFVNYFFSFFSYGLIFFHFYCLSNQFYDHNEQSQSGSKQKKRPNLRTLFYFMMSFTLNFTF